MGQEIKKGGLTPEEKDFLEKLYLSGEVDFVKYKMPRREKTRKEEIQWISKMAELILKLKHTPRQAQIAISKTEEFQEWNKTREKKKIKKNQEFIHYKDAENLFSKWMRTGGITSLLKRNKRGSVKGVKKKK